MRPYPLLLMLALFLAGCPGEESVLVANPRPTATTTTIGGGVSVETPNPSPTPTAKPHITDVVASPLAVSINPAPLNATLGLGLPTEAQVNAYAMRSDGSKGPVEWVASDGLSVVNGLFRAGTALPGIYYAHVRAAEDPNMFREIRVEVRGEGEFEVTIQ